SSRRRHTRFSRDWSSDVCSSDLRLRYVFRHRPIAGSEIAQRAAELVETARTPEQFWKAHVTLMTRSETLTDDDLRVVAEELGVGDASELPAAARARVARDIESASASGVHFTPTFFINGRRYDGAWDESSFSDAMLGTLGYKVRVAALSFASWAPKSTPFVGQCGSSHKVETASPR